MITVKNRDTNLVEEVMGNGSGALVVESAGRYQDLGAVIDEEEVAVGASVYSPWVDGVEWVRGIMTLTQGDQAYDAGYERRDSALIGGGWPQNYLSAVSATAPGSWRASNSSALLGYSARFAMTNKGAEEGIFSARVQLHG